MYTTVGIITVEGSDPLVAQASYLAFFLLKVKPDWLSGDSTAFVTRHTNTGGSSPSSGAKSIPVGGFELSPG